MSINLNAEEWSFIERCDQRFILFSFDTWLLCNFNKRKLNWFSTADISGWSKQNILLLFACMDGTLPVFQSATTPVTVENLKEALYTRIASIQNTQPTLNTYKLKPATLKKYVQCIGFTMLNNDLYRMKSENIPLLEIWVNHPTMFLAHLLIPLDQSKLQFLQQKNPFIPIYHLGWKEVWSFIGIHEIAVSYDFRIKTSVNRDLTGLIAFLIRRTCRILQQNQLTYDNKHMWILALTMFEQHPRVVVEFPLWHELKRGSNTKATSTDRPTIIDVCTLLSEGPPAVTAM